MTRQNDIKRVGIFSGAFDPVHNGHLQFAHDALERIGLDKVFFLVEPRPRRKQGVKAFEHRLAMVQLAVKDNPKFGLIILEQTRFTPHETLPVLLARFKGAQLHMLMGDDVFQHLGDWPGVERFVSSTYLIIGVRGPQSKVIGYLNALEHARGLGLNYEIFESTFPEVSSSKVKATLRKSGISEDIPPEVQNYINEHELYVSKAGA